MTVCHFSMQQLALVCKPSQGLEAYYLCFHPLVSLDWAAWLSFHLFNSVRVYKPSTTDSEVKTNNPVSIKEATYI